MHKIYELIKEFNLSLPNSTLRRNSLYYEFYCYINNMFSMIISERKSDAMLFIDRAKRFIEKYPERVNEEENFFKYSVGLLRDIEDLINE